MGCSGSGGYSRGDIVVGRKLSLNLGDGFFLFKCSGIPYINEGIYIYKPKV